MSVIEKVADVDNAFLSRRELTCHFAGLAGKLKRTEAVEMVEKEYGLGGKVIIPMRLKTHVGKPAVTGTFYVYDDEALAKKHVNPTIFSRLERAQAKLAEAQEKAAEEAKAQEAAKPEGAAEGAAAGDGAAAEGAAPDGAAAGDAAAGGQTEAAKPDGAKPDGAKPEGAQG